MPRFCRPGTLLVLAMAGCGADPPPPPPSLYPGPPQALLGGGVIDFNPLATCDQVGIIHGQQGGYHVWGSVRARYINPKAVSMRFTITDVATANAVNVVDFSGKTAETFFPVAPTRVAVGPAPTGGTPACPDGGNPPSEAVDAGLPAVPGGTDGWFEDIGVRMFLPQTWIGCQIMRCVHNRRLLFHLDVTDRAGRTASDERELVPVLDPTDATAIEPTCYGDSDAGVVAIDLGAFVCP
jgi:hypothetical protein